MRKVRTCDFCGDDATGLYEPLPPSIPGAPRMLLCDPCRDRLSSVVDPLLAQMGDDVCGDAGGRSARSTATGANTTSTTTDAGSRTSGRTGHTGTDDLGTREWPENPREASEESLDGPDDVGSRQHDARNRTADESPDAADASAGPMDASAGPSDDSTPAEESARADAGTPPTSIDDLAEDSVGDAEVSESRDASGRTQRERGGAPRGYRKVVRFLENRELPMDRVEAERLAAEAYELDVDEVSAAIDHAVQYGRLREVSGELRR